MTSITHKFKNKKNTIQFQLITALDILIINTLPYNLPCLLHLLDGYVFHASDNNEKQGGASYRTDMMETKMQQNRRKLLMLKCILDDKLDSTYRLGEGNMIQNAHPIFHKLYLCVLSDEDPGSIVSNSTVYTSSIRTGKV